MGIQTCILSQCPFNGYSGMHFLSMSLQWCPDMNCLPVFFCTCVFMHYLTMSFLWVAKQALVAKLPIMCIQQCTACQKHFSWFSEMRCLLVLVLCIYEHALFAYVPFMGIQIFTFVQCTFHEEPDAHCFLISYLWVFRHALLANVLLIASRPALAMLPMSLLLVPRDAASQCSFYGSLCIVCQCSFKGDPDILCLQVFFICVSKHALFANDPTMSIRTCTVYGNLDMHCLPICL